MEKRISWIDIARGIGIIFVIYAHVFYVLGSSGYSYLLYAFHIPLFFFLSGVVFNKPSSLIAFLKKSVKRLLVPYFIFAFMMYGLWAFHVKTTNTNINSPEVTRQFFSIFYGNSNNGLVFNDALWFLPALFVTRIAFSFITKVIVKRTYILLILLFFSVVGYLLSVSAPTIKLPFGIETVFSAIVFYGLGFLWNRSEKAKEFVFNNKYLLFPILLVSGSILATVDFNHYGHPIDMRTNQLNNYFLFYTNAFLGIFTWLAFSKILNNNSILETIGKNSLILFAWHPIVFTYITIVFNKFSNSEIIKSIMTLIPAIYTAVSVTIILFANSLIGKLKIIYSRFR
jgi:acyltransferase